MEFDLGLSPWTEVTLKTQSPVPWIILSLARSILGSWFIIHSRLKQFVDVTLKGERREQRETHLTFPMTVKGERVNAVC